MPSSLTVIQWVADFSERVKQLQHVSKQVASHGAKSLKVGNNTWHLWIAYELDIFKTKEFVLCLHEVTEVAVCSIPAVSDGRDLAGWTVHP